MSVYKEGFHAVSEINNHSRQVYPDACDYGVPTKPGHWAWNMIKGAVQAYGVEGTRKVDRYLTGVTVENVIELMDEWLERGAPGYGKVLRFKFTYTSAKGLQDGYTGYVCVEPVN